MPGSTELLWRWAWSDVKASHSYITLPRREVEPQGTGCSALDPETAMRRWKLGGQKTEGTERRQCKNSNQKKKRKIERKRNEENRSKNKNANATINQGNKAVISPVKQQSCKDSHHSHKGPGLTACPCITQLPFDDIPQIIHNAAAHLNLNMPERSHVTYLLHSIRPPAAVYLYQI